MKPKASQSTSPPRAERRAAPPCHNVTPKDFWRKWILGALLPVYLFTTFLGTLARVDGDSMEPSLHPQDAVVLLKYPRWWRAWGLSDPQQYPRRGGVVIFKIPAQSPYAYQKAWGFNYRPYQIKRVLALPGDIIQAKDGMLFVNGQALKEPYVSAEGYVNDFPVQRLSAGQVWVMGDNRRSGASLDSRAYGPVALKDLAGPVPWRLWPGPGGLGVRPSPSGPKIR